MKKVLKIAATVMLGVLIVAVIVFISPWIPVNGGMWAPLDLVKSGYRGGSVEEFITAQNFQYHPEYVEPQHTNLPSAKAPIGNRVSYTVPEKQWENLPQRTEISTMEQVSAYFDSRYPEIKQFDRTYEADADYWQVGDGYSIVGSPKESIDRVGVVNAATYLLSDDMEIYTVIAFCHDKESEDPALPMLAINCIKTEDGYAFVDPVLGMQGDQASRPHVLLPEAEVYSIEEYITIINDDPELYRTLDYLYIFKDCDRIEFYVDDHGVCNLRYPLVKSLYQNLDKRMSDEKRALTADVKPENIQKYQLSWVLGGTTLTPDEARELVRAKPEEAKEKVKTAADLLMYMMAAKIGDVGMCNCDQWGEYVWHSNLTAREVMGRRLANCGASANLANYLLEGDYEEIGFIQHALYKGNGGGHVYNYILHEGKYYIVDFSWYIFNNYDIRRDFPIYALNALEEYTGNLANRIYGNVSLVIACTTTGQHLPNIFGEDYNEDPYHYYVPEGAQYQVLYEAGDGYLIAEKPLDKKYHDWTVFWSGYEAP